MKTIHPVNPWQTGLFLFSAAGALALAATVPATRVLAATADPEADHGAATTDDSGSELLFDDDVGDFDIKNEDFADLMNNYRFSQPSNVPWSGSYWAYGNNGISVVPQGQDKSPADKFDAFFGLSGRTAKWETKQHSCAPYMSDKDTYSGCTGWWGHCNAWSAAGIKEPEPSKDLSVSGKSGDTVFTVADRKALLTELWMDSGALFAGHTNKNEATGPWVYNPDDPISKQMTDDQKNNYQSFWDPSPEADFLIFTNYMGIMKLGVVIDRFTGDEVWNQPIVGYRVLPIRPDQDLFAAESVHGDKGDAQLYPVAMRMKIYWANDDVDYGHVSSGFNIAATTDDEAVEAPYMERENDTNQEYVGRLLKFKLFLDAPVKMSGATIVSAGKIVGSLWDHLEHKVANVASLDQTHPDFIWMPTELSQQRSEGNPFVTDSRVRKITEQSAD